MARSRLVMLVLACGMVVACGASPTNGTITRGASMQQPTVTPIAQASDPAPPPERPVLFSHLPPGTYQVHLHAICNGTQAFHIAYLPDLVVGPSHTGQLLVPTADFGRGRCVIVYADAVHNIVLVAQPI